MADVPLHCRPPAACSDDELRAFEALVRDGFAGSDDGLTERIRAAALLALYAPAPDRPEAIAGLKSPASAYRREVFVRAAAAARAEDFSLELGWVYVVPQQRRRGIAADLCRALLAGAPDGGVFATTRPHNDAMIRILESLGFAPDGVVYPHVRRDEMLRLFLRPGA